MNWLDFDQSGAANSGISCERCPIHQTILKDKTYCQQAIPAGRFLLYRKMALSRLRSAGESRKLDSLLNQIHKSGFFNDIGHIIVLIQRVEMDTGDVTCTVLVDQFDGVIQTGLAEV